MFSFLKRHGRKLTPFLLLALSGPALASGRAAITSLPGQDSVLIRAAQAGTHSLEIDDSPSFNRPILKRRFTGSKLQIHGSQIGLIPGVRYYVRLNGASEPQELQLQPGSTLSSPEATCSILRMTWEETGRLKTGVAFSRLRWDLEAGKWLPIAHTEPIGSSLYNVELYLRPALTAARACDDERTLDEIGKYYLAMLSETDTVGALLSRPNVTLETRERLASTDRSARTFLASFGAEVGEGELYNAQWLHPAARCIRLITLLRDDQRTAAMKAMATAYTRFIVAEHLDRYFVQERLPDLGNRQINGRIARWQASLAGLKGKQPWDSVISDVDLWLLASAAEILGANVNAPDLVPLTSNQRQMLHRALDTGIQFLQSRKNEYPATKNFRGERVGSASYFNGDYTKHDDYAYSGVSSEAFPTGPHQVLRTASWDISHAYRLPVFLRALYENKKATGSQFPSLRDLQLITNQYVYRVFDGDFSRPLFHNYFDGSDGWHRVGFVNSQFGYPPSPYCDARNPNRPCLLPGNISGWGELAFANPDLARLEDALVQLGFTSRDDAKQFRDRYFYYESPYQLVRAEEHPAKTILGTALYFVVAESLSGIRQGPPGAFRPAAPNRDD